MWELTYFCVDAMILPLGRITSSYIFLCNLLPSLLWGLAMLASMFLVLKGTRSLNGAQCVSVGNFKILSLVLTDKKRIVYKGTKCSNSSSSFFCFFSYHCFSIINYFTTIICNILSKKYKRNKSSLFVCYLT